MLNHLIAFSLRTHMHLWNWRAGETEPSASAVKVMIMTAYLRRGSVKNSDLSGDQRYNLEQMIEWSDDHATDRLFAHVHCSGLNSLAHTVGMKRFTACGDPNHPHWGRSRKPCVRFTLSMRAASCIGSSEILSR